MQAIYEQQVYGTGKERPGIDMAETTIVMMSGGFRPDARCPCTASCMHCSLQLARSSVRACAHRIDDARLDAS
jgi:hypothetical protein